MSRALVALVVLAPAAGCNVTTVTFHPASFVGATAEVRAEDAEVRLPRGTAVAFDCTESTELWSGPCRDFTIDSDDEDVFMLLPAHRLGQTGTVETAESGDQRLEGTVQPTSGVLVALEEGSGTATVASRSSDAVFTVRVTAPATDDQPEPDPAEDAPAD